MTEQTKKETAELEEALSQDVVSEEEVEEVVDVVETDDTANTSDEPQSEEKK